MERCAHDCAIMKKKEKTLIVKRQKEKNRKEPEGAKRRLEKCESPSIRRPKNQEKEYLNVSRGRELLL